MINHIIRRAGIALAAGAIVLTATACAPATPADTHTPGEEAPQSSAPSEPASVNRDAILILVEAPFAGLNGKAKWEDTTLVLTLDGDVNEEEEAQFACGLLEQSLEAGETARLEFPNGTFDCTA